MKRSPTKYIKRVMAGAIAVTLFAGSATAQPSAGIPPGLLTPDKVESSIGTLEYQDGAPTVATKTAAWRTTPC